MRGRSVYGYTFLELPMQSPFDGFPPETLRFLRLLKRNNNREWFNRNKATYEDKVKQPMIELVTALGSAVAGFAPEMVTDPKRAIFRIYRDTRFSPDKTPYKTHVAAHFTAGDKNCSASLYFHLDPDQVLVAGGTYMPPPPALRLIRNYVALHADELRAILREPKFKKVYDGLQGESLTRAPKGFPPDHPDLDLLKNKHFVAWFERTPAIAETPELPQPRPEIVGACTSVYAHRSIESVLVFQAAMK
jgi:uncharacterized protein (TIGR02453 family)